MADTPLLVHNDRIEITGLTKDNNQNTDDISAFLQHDDSKIIVLQIVRNTTITKATVFYEMSPEGSTRVYGGNLGGEADPSPKASHITAIQLGVNNNIRYRLPDSEFEVYNVAEFGGDDVFEFPVDSGTVGGGGWRDVDITADLIDADHAGNVDGVICRAGGENEMGARRNGSTDSTTSLMNAGTQMMLTAQVDDDDIFERFVTISGGKTPIQSSFVNTTGYWLRGSGLVATADRDPAETTVKDSTFNTLNVGQGDFSETEAIVSVRAATGAEFLARTIKSNTPLTIAGAGSNNVQVPFPVGLNSNEELEYNFETSTVPELRIEVTQFSNTRNTLAVKGGTLAI